MGNTYIELALANSPVDGNGFDIGFTAAHIALSTEQSADPFKKLGIGNCGIGGYACTCNIMRVPEGVDVYDFVDGVFRAKEDVTNKVVL